MSNTQFTVIHFQPVTGRWHVEESDVTGEGVWFTDRYTAAELAHGYKEMGYKASTVAAADLGSVERFEGRGSIVLVEARA